MLSLQIDNFSRLNLNELLFIIDQQSCSQCPAGHSCPNQGAAVACPSGFYSNAGDGACSACAPGSYTGSTGN